MRILMWLTLGVAAAMALCAYILPQLPLWAGLLVLPGGLLLYKKKNAAALVCLGFAVGLLWYGLYNALWLEPARSLNGKTEDLSVHVVARDRDTWVTGKTRIGVKGYTVRVWFGEEPLPEPGEQLTGSFTLQCMLSSARDPGHIHQSREVFLRAYPRGELLRLRDRNRLLSLPGRLQLGILDRIGRTFPEQTAAFAQALILGEDRDLEPETDWVMRTSGIRHMIAVSGLHVSILFSLLGTLTGRQRTMTCILGLPLVVGFCAVTGFTPSVVRASFMLGILFFATVLRREGDRLTALSAAVLIMLLGNPLVITSVSFQLSAACVLSIILFSKPIYMIILEPFLTTRFYRFGKWLCSSAAISISALVLVIPLTAMYFGSVSLVSPLTNLLTVWAVAWIFWGILAVLGLSFLSLGAARGLAVLVSLLIRYVLDTAEVLGRLPLSCLYTGSLPVALWLAFAYLLGFLYFKWRDRGFLSYAGTVAAALIVALCFAWGLPRLDPVRISVLDTQKGETVLVRCRGRNILTLSGEDIRDRAVDQAALELLEQGIFRVDALVVTSGEPGVLQSVHSMLARIPARQIYAPEALAEELPGSVSSVTVPETLRLGEARITLVPGEEMNLAVLFEAENYDILITDGPVPEDLKLPALSAMTAAYDGRPESLNPALVKAARPDTLILAPGAEPVSQALLRELLPREVTVLEPREQGTILIRR